MKVCFTIFLFLIGLLHAEPVSYKWVEHDGRMIKQWTITNEKYVPKRKPASTFIANKVIKKIEPANKAKKIPTHLEMDLGYGITSLSTVDRSNSAKGEINSNTVINGNVRWMNAFNVSKLFVSANFQKSSFDAGAFDIQNTEQTLLGGKLGMVFGESLLWMASLNYSQQMFLTVKDQSYSLESLSLPSVELSLKHHFYEVQNWSFNYAAGVELINSGSNDFVEAETGLRGFAGLGVLKKRKNMDINISLGLDYQQQSTTAVEQSLLNFTTGLGTTVHF
ncbi:MAG: hypothetical protein KC478_01900 [Bacteriovoracaceae bacterium]|nr:hypothetical protein [Bacteriovoracaceae bacterium]